MDFLQDPAAFIVNACKYKASAFSQPNFAFHTILQHMNELSAKNPKIDLSSLLSVVSGAEPIRLDVVRSFIEKFYPFGLDPKAFSSGYGQAEHMTITGKGEHFIFKDPYAAFKFVKSPIIPISCIKKKLQPSIAIIGNNLLHFRNSFKRRWAFRIVYGVLPYETGV